MKPSTAKAQPRVTSASTGRRSASVPADHHQAALALKIVGEPNEKVPIRAEITRPTGGVLAKIEGEVLLAGAGAGELQLNIAGLPLPDYGLYGFNIYVADQLSRTAGFNVVHTPQAPPQQK